MRTDEDNLGEALDDLTDYDLYEPDPDDVNAFWRPTMSDVNDLQVQLRHYIRRSDAQGLAERALMTAYIWYLGEHAPSVYLHAKRDDIEDAQQQCTRWVNKLNLLSRDLGYLGANHQKYVTLTKELHSQLLTLRSRVAVRSPTDRSLIAEASLIDELNANWKRIPLLKLKSRKAGFEKLLLWLFAWMTKTTELSAFRCPRNIPTFREKRNVRDMIERNSHLLVLADDRESKIGILPQRATASGILA